MLIVMYGETMSSTLYNYRELMNLLAEKKESRVDMYKFRFEDDVLLDLRSGDPNKLRGLRPDYFFVAYGCGLAREILMQGASKIGGKELKNIRDVADLIEKFSKKEISDG